MRSLSIPTRGIVKPSSRRRPMLARPAEDSGRAGGRPRRSFAHLRWRPPLGLPVRPPYPPMRRARLRPQRSSASPPLSALRSPAQRDAPPRCTCDPSMTRVLASQSSCSACCGFDIRVSQSAYSIDTRSSRAGESSGSTMGSNWSSETRVTFEWPHSGGPPPAYHQDGQVSTARRTNS